VQKQTVRLLELFVIASSLTRNVRLCSDTPVNQFRL